MKAFILKSVVFCIPGLVFSLVLMVALPGLLSLQYGPTTKQQISSSFDNALRRDYQLLILGNSRTYRGLNPDFFTLKAFNFSHDNDSYNQIYHKLLYLMGKGKHFDYLVLGTDYFQFSFKADSRNFVYGDWLGKEYMKDYDDTNLLMLKLQYYLRNVDLKRLLSFRPKKNKPFLRDNGQYIKNGKAKAGDQARRSIKRLDFQVRYFVETLRLCKSNGIKIFIVMPPARKNELDLYERAELIEFNSFLSEYVDNKAVFYLNYSESTDYLTADYTDVTHLNEAAANRFSQQLDSDIVRLIRTQ